MAEVVQIVSYIQTLETLDKYNCDFCGHSSGWTLDSEGLETYRFVKAAGIYKEWRQTISVCKNEPFQPANI